MPLYPPMHSPGDRVRSSPPKNPSRRKILWVLLALCLITVSCTPRTNQFQEFSNAGVAYTDAAEQLIEAATIVAIDADTLLLVESRDVLSLGDRSDQILAANDAVKVRILILRDLLRHARLLRSYFQSLSALAESTSPTTIGEATSGVVENILELGNGIDTDLELGAIASTGASLVVGQFRNAALEQELRSRAATIERELALQETAMAAIAAAMEEDLTIMLQRRESAVVVLPYVRDGTLPGNWGVQRKEVLMAALDLEAARAAESAARQLRTAFIALVEGRFQPADLSALNTDLAKVVSLLELLQGDTEGQVVPVPPD